MVPRARIRQVAAIVGLGLLATASPGVAHALPPPTAEEADGTCQDVAGVNYVRDANDVRMYYLCVDGAQKYRFRCPQFTVLIMAMPPRCLPLR